MNIILGLVLLTAAAAVLATFETGSALWYAAGGGVVCGVGLFAVGLYRAVKAGSTGANAEEVYKSDTITRLIMQSMIITAVADGPLEDEEVELIATACETVVHEKLDRESIRRLVKLVENRGDEIFDEIHSEGRLLNPDARRAVIDGCLLVLKSGNKVDVRQTAAVTAIARKLDFSDDEVQSLIVDALQGVDDV